MNRPSVVVLAVFASTAVWAAVPEPAGYRMDHFRAPVPDSVQGGRTVHTPELDRLIRLQHPVLIDVLPAPTPPTDDRPGMPRLPVGHSDIPGSLWLSDTGRGALAPAAESWFRARLHAATDGMLSRPVVFYCLSQCWMSWNAAKRAVSYGYTQVIWYPDGADGWQAAGLPVAAAVAQRP